MASPRPRTLYRLPSPRTGFQNLLLTYMSLHGNSKFPDQCSSNSAQALILNEQDEFGSQGIENNLKTHWKVGFFKIQMFYNQKSRKNTGFL